MDRPHYAVIEINIDNDEMTFKAVNSRDGTADCRLTREQAMDDINRGAKIRLYRRWCDKHLWSDPVLINNGPSQ